jgi:hypothetical protein
MTTRGATCVLLGAGILAGAGCSTLLGVDPDRHVAADDGGGGSGDAGSRDDATADAAPSSDGGGAEAAGPWSCLSAPREVLDPALQVEVTLVVIDPSWATYSTGGPSLVTISGNWLTGVAVRPCALLDPDCLDAPKAVLTDDAGRAQFSLTGDFAGFFDLRRPDLVPATLYPGHLLAGEPVAIFPSFDLTPMKFLSVASSAGVTVTLDAGVGHVLVAVYDCQDQQASGVSIAYDNLGPQGAPFYIANGLPDLTATETDYFGLAGAFNVPVGTVKATATLFSTGTQVGSASFDVRAGGLTSAWIRVRSR